jgi:hypothetical protein
MSRACFIFKNSKLPLISFGLLIWLFGQNIAYGTPLGVSATDAETVVAENPEEPKSPVVKQEPSTSQEEPTKPEEPKSPVVKKELKEHLVNEDKIKSIIDGLLGETLDGYKDFGFKDVMLGSDLSIMRDKHTLNWAPQKGHIEFMDGSALTSNRYIFNGRNKLVCYMKVLKGGINDYADRIIEIFGKTNQKIEDDVIRYAFEKTLVFVNSGSVGGQRVTVIKIWDRKWIEEVLLEYAANASELLEWQKKTTALVKNKDFDFNTAPKLPGTTVEPNKEGGGKKAFNLFYPKTSESGQINLGLFGYTIPPLHATDDRDKKFKMVPVVNISTTIRLNSTPTNPLYGVKKFDDEKPVSNFAALTIQTKYNSELLLQLVQLHYPSKTNNIEIITPRYGPIIRQWKTKDGWHVQVKGNDVFLSFFGEGDDL